MTVEPADAPAEAPDASDAAQDVPAASADVPTPPDAHRHDAGHLDEDPEALEDPVHRGDAQHQHALHENPPGRTG